MTLSSCYLAIHAPWPMFYRLDYFINLNSLCLFALLTAAFAVALAFHLFLLCSRRLSLCLFEVSADFGCPTAIYFGLHLDTVAFDTSIAACGCLSWISGCCSNYEHSAWICLKIRSHSSSFCCWIVFSRFEFAAQLGLSFEPNVTNR